MTDQTNNADYEVGVACEVRLEGGIFSVRIDLNKSAGQIEVLGNDSPQSLCSTLLMMVAAQLAGEACRDRNDVKSMTDGFLEGVKSSIQANFEKKFVQ